ncbi:hypothetical protein BC834DRAFT_972952 [Gloeopeniophorella convolvens]|nr:hypothetical protein BC834DRAFT_972952 [Gloeopeniophorella convolvens]
MTLLRLWMRRDRYWWDDAWAFFSLLNLIVQFGSVFMHVEKPSDLSQLNRVAAYYLMAATFYSVIWSARVSILFSIIRIDPDPIMRRRLKWLAALFIAALCFFLAQLLWTCEASTTAGRSATARSAISPNRSPFASSSVPDVVADLLLILLPVRLIRGIKDKGLRYRLIFIFSTSIVTTIVSLVHAAYIIKEGGIPVLISALVEDCMSLTVANMPVVATALMRRLGSGGAQGPDDGDGQRWSSFKFRTRTTRPTHWTSGLFGAFSRGGPGVTTGAGVGATTGAGMLTEHGGTFALGETSKSTAPTYSTGSLGVDELYAKVVGAGSSEGDLGAGTKEAAEVRMGEVRREDGAEGRPRAGVVRIDALPNYPPKEKEEV